MLKAGDFVKGFLLFHVFAYCFRKIALAAQLPTQERIHVFSVREASSFNIFEDAVAYVREQMAARSGDITVTIPLRIVEESDVSQDEFSLKIFNEAIEHTEECSGQEGDALRWVHAGYAYGGSANTNAGTFTSVIRPQYYTTLEQEQELDDKVKEVIDSLAYGSNDIIFSYDEYGFQNNTYANDYVDLAGTNDFALPIICYIDANNKF